MLLQYTLFPGSQGSVFSFNTLVTNSQAKKDLMFSLEEQESVWGSPERMVEKELPVSLYEDDVCARGWAFFLSVRFSGVSSYEGCSP